MTTSTDLVYNGVTINCIDSFVSLTDMWRADGRPENQRPSDFLSLPQAQNFIKKLEEHVNTCASDIDLRSNVGSTGIDNNPLISTSRGGRNPGTFAHWQVAIFYAQYLSPAFHIWCNKVIRGVVDSPVEPTRALVVEPPTPTPAYNPLRSDSAVQRYQIAEGHVDRLVRLGKLTEEQGADRLTVLLRDEIGVDLTIIPYVEYKPESTMLPTGISSVARRSTNDFPHTAKEAGFLCASLIEGLRLQQARLAGKPYKALKNDQYGMPFALILRELRLHPGAAQGYELSKEEQENAEQYALRIRPHMAKPQYQFGQAAVAAVQRELARQIEMTEIANQEKDRANRAP